MTLLQWTPLKHRMVEYESAFAECRAESILLFCYWLTLCLRTYLSQLRVSRLVVTSGASAVLHSGGGPAALQTSDAKPLAQSAIFVCMISTCRRDTCGVADCPGYVQQNEASGNSKNVEFFQQLLQKHSPVAEDKTSVAWWLTKQPPQVCSSCCQDNSLSSWFFLCFKHTAARVRHGGPHKLTLFALYIHCFCCVRCAHAQLHCTSWLLTCKVHILGSSCIMFAVLVAAFPAHA